MASNEQMNSRSIVCVVRPFVSTESQHCLMSVLNSAASVAPNVGLSWIDVHFDRMSCIAAPMQHSSNTLTVSFEPRLAPGCLKGRYHVICKIVREWQQSGSLGTAVLPVDRSGRICADDCGERHNTYKVYVFVLKPKEKIFGQSMLWSDKRHKKQSFINLEKLYNILKWIMWESIEYRVVSIKYESVIREREWELERQH